MKKIHEQITEETWCQEVLAQDADGISVPPLRIQSACKWCALGWIDKVYETPDAYGAVSKLTQHLYTEGKLTSPCGIASWNDDPKRTFVEVKEAFQKADL